MENVIACILMAAVSLPLSFFLARTCLRGVVRFVTGEPNKRGML
jgi:hypothetical protein